MLLSKKHQTLNMTSLTIRTQEDGMGHQAIAVGVTACMGE